MPNKDAHNKLLKTVGLSPNQYPSPAQLRNHRQNTLSHHNMSKPEEQTWRAAYRSLLAQSKQAEKDLDAMERHLPKTQQENKQIASKLTDKDFDYAAKHMPDISKKNRRNTPKQPMSQAVKQPLRPRAPAPKKFAQPKIDPQEKALQRQADRLKQEVKDYRHVMQQQGETISKLRQTRQQQQQAIDSNQRVIRQQNGSLHKLKKTENHLRHQQGAHNKTIKAQLRQNQSLVKNNTQLAHQNQTLRRELGSPTASHQTHKIPKIDRPPAKTRRTPTSQAITNSQYSTKLNPAVKRKIPVPKRTRQPKPSASSNSYQQPSLKSQQLQQQIARLRRQSRRLEKKSHKQSRKIRSLRGSISGRDNMIRRQMNTIDKQRKTSHALQARQPQHRHTLHAQQKTIRSLSKQHDALSQQSRQLKAQYSQLEQRARKQLRPQPKPRVAKESANSPVGSNHLNRPKPSPRPRSTISADQAFLQAKKDNPNFYKAGKNGIKAADIKINGKPVEAKIYRFKTEDAANKFRQQIGGHKIKLTPSKTAKLSARATSTDQRQGNQSMRLNAAKPSPPSISLK